jgi:hypothetical protein
MPLQEQRYLRVLSLFERNAQLSQRLRCHTATGKQLAPVSLTLWSARLQREPGQWCMETCTHR